MYQDGLLEYLLNGLNPEEQSQVIAAEQDLSFMAENNIGPSAASRNLQMVVADTRLDERLRSLLLFHFN